LAASASKVRARVAEGDERTELWGVMNDLYASFDEYRERTDRELRVFVLTPTATSSDRRSASAMSA